MITNIIGKTIKYACKFPIPHSFDSIRGKHELIVITFTDDTKIWFRSGDSDGYESFIEIEEGLEN